MLLLHALGCGLLLPALVALGVMLTAGRSSREGELGYLPWLAPALGIALGYAVAHLGLHGFRGVLPTDAMQRLPLVALGSLAVGLADGPRALFGRRIALDVAASAIGAWLLLSPLFERHLHGPPALAVVAVFILGSVLLMQIVTLALAGEAPLVGAIELTGVAVGTAGLAALSGTALVGQGGGAAAAAISALVAFAAIRRTAVFESAGRVIGGMLAATLALAYLYAEMRPEVLGACVAAALAPGGARAAFRGRKRLGATAGGVLALGLMVFALWRATLPGVPSPSPSPSEASSADPTENDYGYQ